MSNSRTINSMYNFISSTAGQFISIIMQFIVRSVFIQYLGKEYLGINGLFSNILSMLSLAELGVGNAILFNFYKPLSENDQNKIKILIKFYKKVYRMIGIVIFILGILIIPLLPHIINDYNLLEELGLNAIFIYMLYLFQSVSSYLFFAYKTSIVKADQKEYKLNIANYLITIISSITQIVCLIIFKKFELYIIILILTVIIQNFIGARIAKKLYPYINEETSENLEKTEIKKIFKDCSAIFLYRMNNVVLKATDNIVISKYLGLGFVGMYSNYYILYTTINTILNKIFDSITHSLGNLHTSGNVDHEYQIFKIVNFIAVVLGATAGIGIFCVSNSFIKLWIGESWVLSQPFALLMGLEIYTLSNRIFLSKYRNSMGLFQQAKYRPLFGAIINLILSIVLVKHLGICGVLIGTIIADWTTIMWFDPLIIHKYGYNNKFSIGKYYIKNLKYLLIVIILGAINYFISTNILTSFEWLSVILHSIICGINVPLIFILFFYKTKEGKYLFSIIKKIINKLKKKK